jgi:tetratricopeptide (TPR) repeat protein
MSKKDPENLIEAIYHYQEAEQHNKASKIAIENSNKILDSGYSMEYNALLERFDEKELKPGIYGEILIAKGRTYDIIGEWKKALNYYNESIDFASINNNEKIMIRAFCESGHILEEQNELKKAKEFFQKGIELSKSIDYSQGMCENFRGLGRINWRNSKYKMAIKNYTKCVELCEKTGENQIMASAYIDMGNAYDEMYEEEKAIEFYEKSLKILKKVKNPFEISRAYMNMASMYKHSGQFNKAIDNYLEQIKWAQPIKAIKVLGYGYSGISLCYVNINDVKKAQKFSKKAEDIAIKIENENIMFEVNKTYALISRHQNKFDEAINFLKKSLELVEKLNAKYYLANTHFEIGLLYEETGDRISAKKHLIAAKNLFIEQDPKKVELVKEKLSKY